MIILVLLNKLKSFLLLFVNIFNRALCCIRRRRRSSCESIPLTHVGVVPNDKQSQEDLENWTDWNDANKQPRTIQDHIEMYRKQKVAAKQELEGGTEQQLNFFEDMTPKITRQTKVLINSGQNENNNRSSNRLSFSGDAININPTSELGEWEESAGWEGETLDWVAQEALREKKKQERVKRAWEQQQKRLEKMNKSLGCRVNT